MLYFAAIVKTFVQRFNCICFSLVINHADFYPQFDLSTRQINSQNDKRIERSAIPCDEDSSPYSIVEPTDYFRSSENTTKVNPPVVIEIPLEKESTCSQETVSENSG